MNERDIDAHVQDIEPTRGNVVGRLSGTGGGKSVTFNAHMDTTFVGTEEDDLPIVGKVENVGRPQARLEDGLIYGSAPSTIKARSCVRASRRMLSRRVA